MTGLTIQERTELLEAARSGARRSICGYLKSMGKEQADRNILRHAVWQSACHTLFGKRTRDFSGNDLTDADALTPVLTGMGFTCSSGSHGKLVFQKEGSMEIEVHADSYGTVRRFNFRHSGAFAWMAYPPMLMTPGEFARLVEDIEGMREELIAAGDEVIDEAYREYMVWRIEKTTKSAAGENK